MAVITWQGRQAINEQLYRNKNYKYAKCLMENKCRHEIEAPTGTFKKTLPQLVPKSAKVGVSSLKVSWLRRKRWAKASFKKEGVELSVMASLGEKALGSKTGQGQCWLILQTLLPAMCRQYFSEIRRTKTADYVMPEEKTGCLSLSCQFALTNEGSQGLCIHLCPQDSWVGGGEWGLSRSQASLQWERRLQNQLKSESSVRTSQTQGKSSLFSDTMD